MSTGLDLAGCIEPVARALWGDPNKALSKPRVELRYGANGKASVDLKKGTWFDHSAGEGGGVLDLIKRETGKHGAEAFEYIRSLGLDIGDAGPQARAGAHRSNGAANGHANGPSAPAATPAPASRGDRGTLVATFDYVDESGGPLFQALRFEHPAVDGGQAAHTITQPRRPRAWR